MGSRKRNILITGPAWLAIFLVELVFVTSPSLAKEPNFIPWPTSLELRSGTLALNANSRIVTLDSRLEPLATVLSSELYLLTGLRIEPARDVARPGDISLEVDKKRPAEHYIVEVSDKVTIRGPDYRTLAMGTATLLQAIERAGPKVFLPQMTIDDRPVASYRGLLIDVARRWHPIETLKQIVVLCRLYKINYIQLHLTDDQSFTFPTKAFPSLPTEGRHYTLEELKELVRFADERGVTLIPEMEGPGHSGKLRKLFGREGTYVLDLASEEMFQAMDTLVGEMSAVFKSSPYFHIGADEAYLKGVGQSDEEKAFMKKYGLQGAGGLYCNYIVRMNEIVKKHGKQTLVWEGFHGEGGGGVTIPRDIIVMAWESRYNPANRLADQGYTLINAAWKPLYVVGSKRWPAELIYSHWNMRLWQHHIDKTNLQLPEGDDVIGAQMCAWEQHSDAELPSTRGRLPAMIERIWNPSLERDFADFDRRFKACDRLLDQLLSPVAAKAEGLIGPSRDKTFHKAMQLTLQSAPEGTIRYTLDGSEPAPDSPAYGGSLTITSENATKTGVAYYSGIKRHITSADMVTIKARLYGEDDRPIGDVMKAQFTHITPKVRYHVYPSQRLYSAEAGHYQRMPDTHRMKPIRTGYWPGPVAGLPMDNHPLLTVPMGSAVETEGTIKNPSEMKYTFALNRGFGQVFINGKLILDTVQGVNTPVVLKAGEHSIRVGYFFPSAFEKGRQTLTYTTSDKAEPCPVADLLVPLSIK